MSLAPTARSGLRILIVEDHVLFAESLELALGVEGYDASRLAVPDDDVSPATVAAAILRKRPRVVLLDLDLGRFGDGARLIAPLAQAGVNVVVVTASADLGRWGETIRLGARTVLSKSAPLNEILAVVRRINQGQSVLDVAQREHLLAQWHEQRSEDQHLRQRMALLTAREREVLAALMQGLAVRDIAAASVVSEATVRTQVKSILAKLEVSSQLAAVGLAHRIGWRQPV